MGYGDEIMASAEARELRHEFPGAKIVVGDGVREYWSDLFEANPNISRLNDVQEGDEIVWLKNHFGARPYLRYPAQPHVQRFKPYRAAPGDVFPSTRDEKFARAFLAGLPGPDLPRVYIEPNVDFGVCKDWGFSRYQEVVSRLEGEIGFIQADYGKRMLDGVHTFNSTTFLRACAVLRRTHLYLGPEGGMHHAAAALGRTAIVLFGGRISPDITGYSFHHNLYVDIPGSPCGSIAPCKHCAACFDRIDVEHVVNLVRDCAGAGESRARAGRRRTA